MEYETEEQQVAALREWWADNGRAIIAGVVLGVLVIGGWQFWQSHSERRALAASEMYSRVMSAVAADDTAEVPALADTLRDDHGGTLYAAYAALAAARVAIDAGDLGAAATRLAWVADNAPQDDVRLVAGVRLARLEGAQGKADEALKRLPSSYPDTFAGLVEEARGDLLVLAGDEGGARAAYEKARASGSVADPDALTMKLNELAVAENAS